MMFERSSPISDPIINLNGELQRLYVQVCGRQCDAYTLELLGSALVVAHFCS